MGYWPFVRGIHRSPVNSHTGQWRGALMFSLICVWINGWVNNGEAGDLRHCLAHFDVTVMHFGEYPLCLFSCDSYFYQNISIKISEAYNAIWYKQNWQYLKGFIIGYILKEWVFIMSFWIYTYCWMKYTKMLVDASLYNQMFHSNEKFAILLKVVYIILNLYSTCCGL